MANSQRSRTCGRSCYEAITPECACICNSTFHGKAGEINRKALAAATGGHLPKTASQMRMLSAILERKGVNLLHA